MHKELAHPLEAGKSRKEEILLATSIENSL